MTPPPFPRIPYLVAPPGMDPGDRALAPGERDEILESDAIVEEKLDGANVVLWLEGRALHVAGRGGAGSMDRGGQLGRLRAWVAERDAALRTALALRDALYGEWLWRTHTVPYSALPDLLVVLDLFCRTTGFATVEDRDEACAVAGLATPPIAFRGVLGNVEHAQGLSGPSRFGAPCSEGLVVRVERDGALAQRAKLLAPGLTRIDDATWLRRGLVLNRVRS